MKLFNRLFKQAKPDSEAPTAARVGQMVAPSKDRPRPVRASVYREANIIYESGYKRRGIVLDYSDNGVRLRFPTNEGMPEFVTLQAKGVGLNGPARVVWQKGSEAGFQLTTI
ncbi:MAG: PilZ domain-containing protein [Hyphomonas sp.]|nr:PilZ domain-containing protein [Hyphomonas sp.]